MTADISGADQCAHRSFAGAERTPVLRRTAATAAKFDKGRRNLTGTIRSFFRRLSRM